MTVNMIFSWIKTLALAGVFSASVTIAQIVQSSAVSSDPGPILGETGFESTLKYCPESRDDDLLPIELLQIHPNPPVM
jgi:hypothetical protein